MTIINKEDFKIKKELNRPILSLDYGENKVGIAISDGNCSIALPSEVYIRNKTDKDFIYIKEFIKKNNVQAVIIGMPYNMDGSEGEKCFVVKNFTKKLLEFIDINIIYWDERMSTLAQEKILIDKDVTRKKRKKVIDKLAASYFLQSFLDFLKY
ncbi:MAG: putative pre-16S rRNA nuclease [Alphaproteobacteria bacterium MarineAlpha6_Bin4]|nr:MAG: putative pre-16S rRNA nuclease [Alphaproteobacteria bacterium MarineAlpha6_Bin5]PPR37672.1 MAG: putative pre-16S rRNA nuclease [Alphaproteobacteria bacterium MarineAlpha6_Bin4]|tara:strand:+ start:3350 stop:3811 length:462 start_codon:yes stop_codon:yes gene_type:complete